MERQLRNRGKNIEPTLMIADKYVSAPVIYIFKTRDFNLYPGGPKVHVAP
jgi:hypothetical protein